MKLIAEKSMLEKIVTEVMSSKARIKAVLLDRHERSMLYRAPRIEGAKFHRLSKHAQASAQTTFPGVRGWIQIDGEACAIDVYAVEERDDDGAALA